MRRYSVATDDFKRNSRNHRPPQEIYNRAITNVAAGSADRPRIASRTRWSRSPPRQNRGISPPRYRDLDRPSTPPNRGWSPPFHNRNRSSPPPNRGRSPPLQNRSTIARGRPSIPQRSPPTRDTSFRARSPPQERSQIRSRSPPRDRPSNQFKYGAPDGTPTRGRERPPTEDRPAAMANNEKWWLPDNDEAPNHNTQQNTNNGSVIQHSRRCCSKLNNFLKIFSEV